MKENYVVLRSTEADGTLVEFRELDWRSISDLSRDPSVRAAAADFPTKLIAPFEVIDTLRLAPGPAWGVKAVGADTSPFAGAGIVVAVLDTGIDQSLAAFSGVQVVQKNFTGDADADQSGHGTFCAGILFGRATDPFRIGVAPGVEKALVAKVLGVNGGSTAHLVGAIMWALQGGANVISMSLCLDFDQEVNNFKQRGLPPSLATARALERYRDNVLLFERLVSFVGVNDSAFQPAILIAAAGNDSRRSERADYVTGVTLPAVTTDIISVAALRRGDNGLTIAPDSNSGATVSAPGDGIVSVRLGSGFGTSSGTSMAVPHVAGVAALWAEQIVKNAELSSHALTDHLIRSTTFDGLQPGYNRPDIGAGLVRAPQA